MDKWAEVGRHVDVLMSLDIKLRIKENKRAKKCGIFDENNMLDLDYWIHF